MRLWAVPIAAVRELVDRTCPLLPATLLAGLAHRQDSPVNSAKILCRGVEVRGPKLKPKAKEKRKEKGGGTLAGDQGSGGTGDASGSAANGLSESMRSLAAREKSRIPQVSEQEMSI